MFFCVFLHFAAMECRSQKCLAAPVRTYTPRMTHINNHYAKIQNFGAKCKKNCTFFQEKMHSDQTNLNQEKTHLLDTESQQVNKSTSQHLPFSELTILGVLFLILYIYYNIYII